VLRGPQGTLFGKNVISGLINITTRKPHGRLEGKLRVEGGNYNNIGATFILNVPVIENKFFAKIAGKVSRSDLPPIVVPMHKLVFTLQALAI
jgi:iron complex outermembrane receptor protein